MIIASACAFRCSPTYYCKQYTAILWRRFRSGPVIIAVEIRRDLRSVFFALYDIVAMRAVDSKTIPKEYYVYAKMRLSARELV